MGGGRLRVGVGGREWAVGVKGGSWGWEVGCREWKVEGGGSGVELKGARWVVGGDKMRYIRQSCSFRAQKCNTFQALQARGPPNAIHCAKSCQSMGLQSFGGQLKHCNCNASEIGSFAMAMLGAILLKKKI